MTGSGYVHPPALLNVARSIPYPSREQEGPAGGHGRPAAQHDDGCLRGAIPALAPLSWCGFLCCGGLTECGTDTGVRREL